MNFVLWLLLIFGVVYLAVRFGSADAHHRVQVDKPKQEQVEDQEPELIT